MKETYIISESMVTPLGFNHIDNIGLIQKSISGIQLHHNEDLWNTPFFASLIDNKKLAEVIRDKNISGSYTKLEKLLLVTTQNLLEKCPVPKDKRTLVILSTTKGNIELLSEKKVYNIPRERAYLSELGKVIQKFFGFENTPVVLSNACVSGSLAIAVAKRMLKTGKYDYAVVLGGDVISEFVLSGFFSFQAISNLPCKPFSKNRTGITLGEAAAGLVLTTHKEMLTNQSIKILGDGTANDANHISGPSRNGEGLYRSIQSALKESGINREKIDYLSAHGTATLYNDEMEAIAFYRSRLQDVATNSLKGYYGHTLGAAGLLETIIGINSIRNNELFKSHGFDELGVSKKINIIEESHKKELSVFMKTSSGFGGCNTAILFSKIK